jgi:hypothetical protein
LIFNLFGHYTDEEKKKALNNLSSLFKGDDLVLEGEVGIYGELDSLSIRI